MDKDVFSMISELNKKCWGGAYPNREAMRSMLEADFREMDIKHQNDAKELAWVGMFDIIAQECLDKTSSVFEALDFFAKEWGGLAKGRWHYRPQIGVAFAKAGYTEMIVKSLFEKHHSYIDVAKDLKEKWLPFIEAFELQKPIRKSYDQMKKENLISVAA